MLIRLACPDFDALAFHEAKTGVLVVAGGPKAQVLVVNLAHGGTMQFRQFDDRYIKGIGGGAG